MRTNIISCLVKQKKSFVPVPSTQFKTLPGWKIMKAS